MESGKIIKSSKCSDEDIELINQYTRRSLTSDEVYCFSLRLCDNEIDRDFEQFPTNELYTIAEMFVGKTGIFDHNPTAANQCARIYRCNVSVNSDKQNSLGEPYCCVIADAYIPISEANNPLIEDIESGIKKEISIGCSVEHTVCSICGKDMRGFECVHKKGQLYDIQLCFGKLCDVADAYEWSFVAVPAQRDAGVIKTKKFGGALLDSVSEKLSNKGDLTLSEVEKAELLEYIAQLKAFSDDGKEYREKLKDDILKLNALKDSEMSQELLRSVVSRMTVPELKSFRQAFGTAANTPQLFSTTEENKKICCEEYSI